MGKFLGIVVLVGDEAPTEVPDAPDTADAEGFEAEPGDWPDEMPCVVVAVLCEESALKPLVRYDYTD
jgi:hypothetical protein